MDRFGVWSAALLALLLLLPAASLLAQDPLYPQIAGTYEVREETVTTVWTGSIISVPETRDTQLWTSEIRQVGNRVSYSTKTPPGFPVIRYPGSLIGNDVVISTTTGLEQFPQFAGLPVVENRYTATGTVENGRLVLRGVARLALKVENWLTVTFDLRVTNTFTGPFTPVPVGRIQLANTGRLAGTVSGLGVYRLGETATLTASWAPGSYFAGWREDDRLVSTDLTYSFTVNGSRKITADFLPVRATAYAGLLQSGAQPTNAGVASWRGSLNAAGTFTGVVVMQGESHRFVGQFDREWELERVVARRGLSPLQISLRLEPAMRVLRGSVRTEDGTFVAALNGLPAGEFVQNMIGRYNSVLPAPSSTSAPGPRGSGYMTMRVGGSGSVLGAGRLANGTGFSFGTRVLSNYSVPVHATLNPQATRNERGNLFGEILSMWSNASDSVYSFVPARPSARYYPEGFSTRSFAASGLWQRSLIVPGNYTLTLTGGGLVDAGGQSRSITKTLRVLANGTAFVAEANPERVSVAFTADGILTGSFFHPGTRAPVRILGIIEPLFWNVVRTEGFFLGPRNSGLVSITRLP